MNKKIKGKIIGINRQGYVDVIQDNFVIKSIKIKKGRFNIEETTKDITLRIRVINSKWRFIKPDKRLLNVVIVPYQIFIPYLMVDGIITRMLMAMFDNTMLEKVNKIKFWRK